MGTVEEISQARHPSLERLLDYWHRVRGARRLPARRDLDPLDFPYILGNVALIEVREAATRYRVRLYGTRLVAWLGHDLTGKTLDECPDPEFSRLVADAGDLAVAEGGPHWDRFSWQRDDDMRSCEALLLPLADDGLNVDMLLLALIGDGGEGPG